MIKYKGFQVAPSELEDILISHPNVTYASVSSVYDDTEATELPCAYVGLKQDTSIGRDFDLEAMLQRLGNGLTDKSQDTKSFEAVFFTCKHCPKQQAGRICGGYCRPNCSKLDTVDCSYSS